MNQKYLVRIILRFTYRRRSKNLPLSSHFCPTFVPHVPPCQLHPKDVHQTLTGVLLPTRSTLQSKENAHESTFITPLGMCPRGRLASITVPLPSYRKQYDCTIARTNSTTAVVVKIDTNSAIDYCPIPNRCQVTSTTYRGRLGCHGIR